MLVGFVAQRVGVHMGMGKGWGAGAQPIVGDGEVLGGCLRQKIPVMGNGYARSVQAAQDVDDSLAGIVIEAVGGLVKQQGLGLHGHH